MTPIRQIGTPRLLVADLVGVQDRSPALVCVLRRWREWANNLCAPRPGVGDIVGVGFDDRVVTSL